MSSIPHDTINAAFVGQAAAPQVKELLTIVDGAAVGKIPKALEAAEVSAFEKGVAKHASNLYQHQEALLPLLRGLASNFAPTEKGVAPTGNTALPEVPSSRPLSYFAEHLLETHPLYALAKRLAQTPPGQNDATGTLELAELNRALTDKLLDKGEIQRLLGVYKGASFSNEIPVQIPWAAKTPGVSATLVRKGYVQYDYSADKRTFNVGNRALEVQVPEGYSVIVVTYGEKQHGSSESPQRVAEQGPNVRVDFNYQTLINQSQVDIYVVNASAVVPTVVDRISVTLPADSQTRE